MHPTAGQPPDEKTVNGAEKQFASSGAVSRALDSVKNPRKFCGAEIRVEKQPGLFRDHGLLAGILHHRANISGPPVLPDNRIVDGFACGAVPDHGGFALVGDADGSWNEARDRASARMVVVTSMVVCQMSSGSCSTQPSAGKCCGNSADRCASMVPSSSKRMARELVVP